MSEIAVKLLRELHEKMRKSEGVNCFSDEDRKLKTKISEVR